MRRRSQNWHKRKPRSINKGLYIHSGEDQITSVEVATQPCLGQGIMSLLSLNYRGLGNRQTVHALVKVINKHDHNIVFLTKTKSSLDWMLKVRDWCKYKNGFIVPNRGSSGGLALFWKQEIRLDIQTYSHSHVDAWVDGGNGIGWWHLTGFYGEPDTSKR